MSVFSLLLFFMMLCFGEAARGTTPVDQSNCSRSSACGEIQNISFPFGLKGTTDQSNCYQQPLFELSCDENNNTIFEINATRYHVKQISYNDQKIRLVDINLMICNCSTLPNSTTGFDFIYYGIYDQVYLRCEDEYYATFVNCSKSVNSSEYVHIPCLSGNTWDVYVTLGSPRRMDQLEVSCSFVSKVLVNAKDLQYNSSSSSYPTVQKLFQKGFELEWFEINHFHYHDSFLQPVYYLYEIFPHKLCSLLSNDETFVDRCSRVLAYTFMGLTILKIIQKIILVAIILVFVIYNLRKNRITLNTVEKFLRNHELLVPNRYSYTEIIGMTSHFREKLGQGGFGSVYKGQVPGCLMAVKLLGNNSKCNGEEFINEVAAIGRIHHVNVVKLVGFCSEGSKRALVYEYMPNGSLDKYIFSKEARRRFLSWEKLHDIALGTAKGIEYLHRGCDMCILHFDIKPHNILLDHSFTPKVSDFGLSKLCPKEYDFVSVSTIRGTIGYIAPELISRNFGVVSNKSDVYSFGMLLLEMAGGRKNVDVRMDNLSEIYFPSWVYDQLHQGRDLHIDENATEIETTIAKKLCIVGLWCIQMKPVDRPSMSKVIQMLEENIDTLQMPPKPVLSSPGRQVSMRGSCSYSNSTEMDIVELE